MANRPSSAEINPGPGFRVRNSIQECPQEILDEYRKYATPDISDTLNRMYSMSHEIKNLVNSDKIVGRAVTVKVFPGDNLMIHKALDILEPGDVIVVDAAGSRMNAVFGDLVASKAKHRGCAGYVIDGLIRDLPAVKEVGLPIYARGVTPIGPLHRGPGEINYPVSCGGIVVLPGDIIVADEVGIVVVRRDFAEDILGKLKSQKELLEKYIADVKVGKFSNDWVDKQLNEAGCVFND